MCRYSGAPETPQKKYQILAFASLHSSGQEADIKSDFTVYNIPLLLFFYSLYVIGGVSICSSDNNNFFSSKKSQSELSGVYALSFLGEGKLN